MEGAHREGGEGGLSATRAATLAANKLFFPAAAAYAAAILPVSLLPFLGHAPALPGLATAGGHAHEMLFGFALAAVAGHQLGPVTRPALWTLLGVWMLARIAYLVAPDSVVAVGANAAFAAALGIRLLPRLLTSIKKPRNLAMPLALAVLCASAIALEAARQPLPAWDPRTVLRLAVAMLALLMLFIGGRLIAPAVAGQFYRQRDNLQARVQPRLEGALIVAMLVAAVATLFRDARADGIAAFAFVVAGSLAAVRMARWRLWKLRGRADLLCLAAGYAWLAVGLIAWGVALAAGRHGVAALHAITVGSLGTLTLNVMALTWARQARRDPAATRFPVWATALIAAATVARGAADFADAQRVTVLALAAACWSAAFLLLLARLAILRPRRVP